MPVGRNGEEGLAIYVNQGSRGRFDDMSCLHCGRRDVLGRCTSWFGVQRYRSACARLADTPGDYVKAICHPRMESVKLGHMPWPGHPAISLTLSNSRRNFNQYDRGRASLELDLRSAISTLADLTVQVETRQAVQRDEPIPCVPRQR
jgi:hypothetical protein